MKKNIMTVEDSPSLREAINFTLSGEDYRVIEAEDGLDALNKIDNHKIDLVITDLNMPNMDGIELTRTLRANKDYRFVPILFLTTESQMQKKETAKELGATGWIVKPFKPDHLVRIVDRVLR